MAKLRARRAAKPKASSPRPRPKTSKRHKAAPSAPEQPMPNLLVSIDERHRALAETEVMALLKRAGYPEASITQSPGAGLIGVRVACDDPRDCIPKLKALLMETPFDFQHTHRWLPVEAWAKAETQALRRFAEMARAQIGNEDSWGIQLERHGSDLDRERLVDTVARGIDNPNVDLEKPQKTVMLEVVGDKAGLAVLDVNQSLSVERTIRDEFVEFQEVRQ